MDVIQESTRLWNTYALIVQIKTAITKSKRDTAIQGL